MNPTIISVINHKGGVSKTTSVVNLAAGLSLLGKKVLVIDLDTQMNLTHSLIGDIGENELSISEAILNDKIPLSSVIRKTPTENVDIIPSGESMIDLDLKLQSAFGRESLLKRALSKPETKAYDFIILDNQPHLGLTTVNSLVASHKYIVPVSAEYLPMVGLRNLIKTIEQIRPLNPSISNLGYLLTMVDRREGISGDVEGILRENFGEDVFKTIIRVNTKLKACPQKRQTIFQAEKPSGKGYTDYLNATKELLKRTGNNGSR
jgi:chromosome partitioning protein